MTTLTIPTDGSSLQPFGGPNGTSDYGQTFIATQAHAGSVTFYAEGSLAVNSLEVRALIVPVGSNGSFGAPIYTGSAQTVSVSGSAMTAINLSLGDATLTVGSDYAALIEYVPASNYGGDLNFASNWTGSNTQEAVWYNGQQSHPSLPASGSFATGYSWWGEYLSLETTLSYAIPVPAPVVTISTAGILTNTATQIISGSVDVADAGSTVSIYDGAALVGTAIVAANGSWSASVVFTSNGSNVIVAKDTNSGGTGTSGSVTFTLDTHTPAAPAGLAVAGAVTNNASTLVIGHGSAEVISGTAEAGNNVAVYDGTTLLGTTTAAANGSWSLTPATLSNGVHALTAIGTDPAGTASPKSAALSLTVDTGPVAATGSDIVGHGSSNDLTNLINSLVTPGVAGDAETITAVSGAGASLVNGHVIFAAPNAAGSSSFTYTVTDEAGDNTTGTMNMTVDGGPSITAATRSINLATGQNAQGVVQQTGNLADANWLLTAGGNAPEQAGTVFVDAPGNADFGGWVANNASSVWVAPNPTSQNGNGNFTITDSFTLNAGEVASASFSGGAWSIDDSGTIVLNGHTISQLWSGSWGQMNSFTLPTADLVVGVNTISVIGTNSDNQIEATRVQGVLTVGVTAAPTLVGHGQQIDLTAQIDSTITAGRAGDTETISSVSGNAQIVNGHVIYTAPNAAGADSFSYTVTDQYGDSTTGTYNLNVDGGPTLANGTLNLAPNQPVDVTAYLKSLITPGLVGDTETITAVSGDATLSNGHVLYTAPNHAGADSFTYTVTDEYGDTATATVNATLTRAANVVNLWGNLDVVTGATTPAFPTQSAAGTINGTAQGYATITGDAQNRTINAFGYDNTIVAGGGNDTINAGLSWAHVTVSDTNGNNLVQGSFDNATVTLGDGNNTLILGGYENNITLGNGNNTVLAGSGIETVTLGNGNNSLSMGGYGNVITLGNGQNTVDAGLGQAHVTIAGGTTNLTVGGYDNTIAIGNGDTVINGAAGWSNITLGNGHSTISATGGSDTITLGSGSANVTLGNWHNSVIGGQGQDNVVGGYGNTYQLNALSPQGGFNVADFNAQSGDVLDLSHVTAALAPCWSLTGTQNGDALDVSVVTGGQSFMVAALHGTNGASVANLIASHNIAA